VSQFPVERQGIYAYLSISERGVWEAAGAESDVQIDEGKYRQANTVFTLSIAFAMGRAGLRAPQPAKGNASPSFFDVQFQKLRKSTNECLSTADIEKRENESLWPGLSQPLALGRAQ
jgi:hypothetical protein